jgi:D-alanyl-D-alanine carboxypeptidase (penicillin-binding protein 5/6)
MNSRSLVHALLVLILSLVLAFSNSIERNTAAASDIIEEASSNRDTVSHLISTSVNAPSAILLDLSTGDLLWQKNSNEKRSIASTTKMMTAILAIENGNLDDTVVIDKDVLAAGTQGGIKLSPGENLKLKDLLYALLLYSANDAAVAIAGHISGSVDNFAHLMNDKAISLGTSHTHFDNPHGLDDKTHFSTARDIAVIARYCLKNKVFADIVSTKTKDLERSGARKIKRVKNRNELLFSFDGANGVKTGHTQKAGYCLVSSAERNGISLLSVILGAKTQKAVFQQSAQLLDYGFGMFENRCVLRKGVTYKVIRSKYGQRVRLTSDRDLSVVMTKTSKTRVVVWSDNNIEAPLAIGKHLGKIAVLKNDRVVATADLVAMDSLKRPNLSKIMSYYWIQFADFIL